MSWPPTLREADDVDISEHVDHFSRLRDLSTTVTVIAPCCGRRCAADMVVDLRGLPGTRAGPRGRTPEVDLAFACDGCRWRIIHESENGWTRSKMHRALGAPAEEVRHTRAKELARERQQQDFGGPDGARLLDAYVREALDEMGDGMPEGTEPPTSTPSPEDPPAPSG